MYQTSLQIPILDKRNDVLGPPNYGNHCSAQNNIHLSEQIEPTYSSLDVPERMIDIQPNMQWGNQQRDEFFTLDLGVTNQWNVQERRQIALTHSSLDGEYNMNNIVDELPSFRNFIRKASF
ncbi:hypothetical protein HHK36_025735 [Tetracentron sinense]|uniref:Uncharacterized protein n=1 Tax=Tetracentron sinense TaxID=13715 RepID=A0A834YJB4_TETSI|nr:hypothetical protein HHK36_025735 [Tetracentron sinense]